MLAAVAAVGILTSGVLDVFVRLRPIESLPIVYDLCMAYLMGWMFNILVVVIPERRKVRAIIRTLRGNLMMIANNGSALIHDLEFIGRCPQRPITEDHVLKVCTANSYNDAMKLFFAKRLSVARDAYRRVIPFMASLPPTVAIAIQEVDQQVINLALDAPDHLEFGRDADPNSPSPQLSELRTPQPVWTITTGEAMPKRQTLAGWKTLIIEYHISTERVSAAVMPYIRGSAEQSEIVEFWINHKINDLGYPFMDYPADAFTDEWLSTPPRSPIGLL